MKGPVDNDNDNNGEPSGIIVFNTADPVPGELLDVLLREFTEQYRWDHGWRCAAIVEMLRELIKRRETEQQRELEELARTDPDAVIRW